MSSSDCCFYTLVLFTYFDVRARLSISDFRRPPPVPPPPGGRFQVSLVPMLEQRITLNSVLKISQTGTLFTVFPTKCTHFRYVLINSIFFKTVKNLRYSSIMVPSMYFIPNHSVYLSDLRNPTLFPLKCHFSDPKR